MAEEIRNNEYKNFIHAFIEEDIAEGGQYAGMTVHTRFPPEPNGYLHIGHCKALCIDFGTAEKFGGLCNLRMDDTNPTKEDVEYVEAIKEDIHWLGFDWGDRFYYASQYFDKMYECAEELIRKGLAYVCELTPEQMREYRGDLTTPARSPYRDRPMEESLDLFRRMKAGEFPNGAMTLRAKIDLASGNFNMRDPAIYRINHMPHHATGDKWCIYPMYDFAHPIEDAMEHITHSLCSLEFEAHRPLYNWVVEHCSLPAKPRQIEFARLGIDHTVMSKRKLRQLVEEGKVSGWDDPRMPTLCGLRRRGYTPMSIRNFCERIGVAKTASTVEYAFLEHCLREDLNETAQRVMAVLHPVKLVLTNYPEGQTETFEVENNPNRPEDGTREVSFSRELWIEAEDFLETPIPKYKRLYPGNEVRLKGAYLVTCTGCKKNEDGSIAEIYAEYDPESRGGNPADGRKVKGATIHWVDAATAKDAEVRLYDNLFSDAEPDAADKNFMDCLNPASLEVLENCKVEASLAGAEAPGRFQFMRLGYFCLDSKDSHADRLVFNRSVSLKDSFKA
ncbi:MAG: glutamine--tRNA ligase/YqeY domain fusion protein [Oscillospiraceae bacterium]|nr:glutamine--tRNA ligase/YqeY domain fusion protein [Oscillospiraceae bacterium]MBQ2203985.1 glutamine--tRNA ligase/YqeY domain fusion protein [Oscillospiraceae bacterium]MBQ4301665.1 glutamine--tRNA ligase/YqeY domain fusion protein [Oscillospiraceae bacterium]